MPVTVKKIILWRGEVDNQPGALATILEQPAKLGADFQIVMGYRHAATPGKATIEAFPVTGKKLAKAAAAAGLSAAAIPTLLIQGDDKPGLGHNIAQAMSSAGINIAFLVAQVIGKKFSLVVGFESEDDAKKATPLIKKASKGRKA